MGSITNGDAPYVKGLNRAEEVEDVSGLMDHANFISGP
jgi:hypothetical protein